VPISFKKFTPVLLFLASFATLLYTSYLSIGKNIFFFIFGLLWALLIETWKNKKQPFPEISRRID
jgi:hypothetical protein